MHRDELILLTLFSISVGLLLYSLGASVTGYVIQTMYCEYGYCKEYCRFNSDCIGADEVCCEKDGFGVCTSSSECKREHKFKPQVDISVEQMEVILEKPAPDYKKEILMFATLLIALIILVAFHHKRKKVSKKQ